jgi:hypothetical protein
MDEETLNEIDAVLRQVESHLVSILYAVEQIESERDSAEQWIYEARQLLQKGGEK